MNEKLYTSVEVAAHLKVHVKTLQMWVREGRIRGEKVGRKWLFTDEQVRSVFETGEAKPKEA